MESEKKRIARELHDTTVQNLTAMIHKIEYCSLMIDKDPIEVKLELQTMISTLRSTISEMRDIIYDLRPMSIDDLSLKDSLMQHIHHLLMQYDKTITLDVSGEEPVLSSALKLHTFRLFQEALNNALKHAQAEQIHVNVFFDEKQLHLKIRDDGCGFDQNMINKESSFGLSIMEERVSLLDGIIHIQSTKGKGTEVYVILPYNTKEGENI